MHPNHTHNAPNPDDFRLAVRKAVGQISFLDRTYGLGLWPKGSADVEHDLVQMYAHRDLESVRLELLAADQSVLFEFRVCFGGNDPSGAGANGNGHANGHPNGHGRPRVVDSGGGVEAPVLDGRLVAGKRFVVQRHGRDEAYRRLLRLNWTNAAVLPKRAGSQFDSDHARRISGGRQQGQLHVGAEARHTLLITSVSDRGFAFARDLVLNLENVWLHARFAPQGYRFAVGKRVTAVVIQTPRGLQGRDIVPAPPPLGR